MSKKARSKMKIPPHKWYNPERDAQSQSNEQIFTKNTLTSLLLRPVMVLEGLYQ